MPAKTRDWSRAPPAVKLLLQEELLMALGIVVEHGDDFVAALFVEGTSLEGVGVELHRMAMPLARIGFGLVHQLGRPAFAAHGFVDPEIGDVQPAAPDGPEQPTHHLAAFVLQEEVERVIGRLAGNADIEEVEVVAHELRLLAPGLIKNDREFTFRFHSVTITPALVSRS
jgi:hypothetical protein